MQPLFSPEGESALASVMQRRPLLAFDFDGTLAPIVDRPEEARLPAAWAVLFAELKTLLPVAIVTGRSVVDVAPRLSFEPHYILGNHGAEDPHGTMQAGSVERLDALRHELALSKPRWSALGIELEDKHYSLALHYRLAADQEAARICIEELVAGKPPGLHFFHGKCVMNVAPDDADDKADAVMSLVERVGAGAALFAGDDINDEPVFERVPADWLTVKVGHEGPPSRARFGLSEQADMGQLLRRLLQLARALPQSS